MKTTSTLTLRNLTILIICTFFFPSLTNAQAVSPKLKFSSPVLVSGTAGQKKATYKFSNVISGVDAFVKIESIKNGATLTNIDDSTLGYYDAWQPVIGGPGTPGLSYIKWAIEFKTTSGSEYKFPVMDLTAVDVDGDNSRVREFIDMNGQSSADVPTIIPTLLNLSNTSNDDNEEGDDDSQENLHALAPVSNRVGIDTASLDVKINYHFSNKSKFKVSLGSQVDGTTGAVATDRYNSLYFMSTSNVLIVLPVTYRVFDATVNNNKVNLSWITDLETLNNHFEIERSFDQTNFSTIAIILAGQSDNTSNQYNFVDASAEVASHKVMYYRLKQIDANGKFNYSEVKMARIATVTKATVQIFPNPFMDKLNVNFVSDATGKAEVRLINAGGNIIKVVTSLITKGFNTVQLQDLNSQAPGVYIANIINNGQVVASLKVIK